jgi:adenylate kinase
VRLSHHYVIPHVATGDMLRAEVRHNTDLGREARRYMDEGELIPDEVITAMVAKRLDQDDTTRRGFVLDGFPRTVAQAEALEAILAPETLDIVINLLVPTQLVLERLASRRVCEVCGENYSVQKPPAVNWTCDVCSGDVVQRDDDTPAAISRRLDLYEKETAPLIAWYRQAGLLRALSGVGSPDAVSDRIIAAVDATRDPQHGGPFSSWEHGHFAAPRPPDEARSVAVPAGGGGDVDDPPGDDPPADDENSPEPEGLVAP